MKKLVGFMLVLTICMGFVASVSAYQVTKSGIISIDDDTWQWWTQRYDDLSARGIYQNSMASFSEGLLRIFHASEIPSQPNDNYLDLNGNLVDLNRGRFVWMSTFHEEMASTSMTNENGYGGSSCGFINKNGDMVLDTKQYGSFEFDGPMTSRFVDGKALMYDADAVTWISDLFDNDMTQWESKQEYVVIDTKGNELERIVGGEALMAHPLFETSLANYDGVPLGVLINPEAYAGTTGETTVPEEVAPPTKPDVKTTYGQSTAISKGYTIENNIGYLVVEVTNPTPNKDVGDVFYIYYAKYKGDNGIWDSTTEFLPSNLIQQLHYEVEPNSVTTLRIPMNQVGETDQELTQENIEAGWSNNEYISASRFVLAQAETAAESEELVTFLKRAHDYGEMQLSYEAVNGVTILANPMPRLHRAAYLNEKFSYFTNQF